MAQSTTIEWTEATWNPIAGCSLISPGCTNCYAMRMAARLEAMHQVKYEGLTRKSGTRAVWTGKVNFDEASLNAPKSWRRGRTIFVNSMSDLFHEDVELGIILRVFKVMEETPQHTYQLLTKRSDRLKQLASKIFWPQNVWMGVSVENADYKFRIDDLRSVPAAVRFLSLEPLLGDLEKLNLKEIDWVIAGGESGPKSRPVRLDWVRNIRDECLQQTVPFHFKQWGGVQKKKTGRELDGRTWDELPSPKVRSA
jgi:protein gp37